MTTVAPRPILAALDDVRRYKERLALDTVKASAHWVAETQAKLDAAQARLDKLTGGAQ